MTRVERWDLPPSKIPVDARVRLRSVTAFEPGVLRDDAATVFGPLLREARRSVGLSQETLAQRAGFDRTYPSLLERGLRNPSLVQLLNLGSALTLRPGLLVDLTALRLGVSLSFLRRAMGPSVGERLWANTARLCRLRGLSFVQLANRVGLDHHARLQLQEQRSETSLAQLEALASRLNCDVVDLLVSPR